MEFIARFQEYVRSHSLLDKTDRVLLAVSGGVDSMVMMSLFCDSGYNVGVAHCNFQLRGEESEEDEVLVGDAAARYGVPFYNMRFDTAGEMARTGESVQLAARRLRYTWFQELCDNEGYDAIVIAHHADDSIETFFINMLRGTGLRGLTGIHKVNGRIVRPLLFASRREILDYANAHHIPFREDSSNSSRKYLRNKIRLGLIPRIKEISPNFTNVMSGNVKRLSDAQMFISHAIERIRADVEERRDGYVSIDPMKIDAGFPVDFVIYELLSTSYGFKGDVVDSLVKTLRDGVSGKRFYARDHMAYTDRRKIIVAPIEDDDLCAIEVASSANKVYTGGLVLQMERLDVDDVDTLIKPENVALLDARKLEFPLEVRRWQDGDSFTPFGMSGRKKVSDYLVDAKVPVHEKKRQLVLVSGGCIAWLVGRRIDDAFRVGTDTEDVLKITSEDI